MYEMSFIDIVLCIKKRIGILLLCTVFGTMLAVAVVMTIQSYTATVSLEYTHPKASEGMNPTGGKLNAYEIMTPVVISRALAEMNTDLTVEEVRNNLSVSPVIQSTTAEVKQALTEKGEVYEVYPVEYTIQYQYKAKYGSRFGNQMLYNILKAYDAYYSEQYLGMTSITDFMHAVDINSMDYMEICDYMNMSLQKIIQTLSSMEESSGEFRSLSTGMDFTTLRTYFDSLYSTEYKKIYANVRQGLLSKDTETLVKKYQKKLEILELERENNAKESALAHDMVAKFYEQYKKNNLYYQARTTQSEINSSDSNSDNKSVVYDYDLSLMVNTYDDMLLRFVDAGTTATNLEHDIAFYKKLISEFESDTVPTATKQSLIEQTDILLKSTTEQVEKYAKLATHTLLDYYEAQVAQNLQYVMAVLVTPNLSVPMFVVLGAVISFLCACVGVIIVRMLQIQLQNEKGHRATENGAKGLASIAPEMVEKMLPLERAFYEQAKINFREFHLLYLPVVNKNLKWDMAEALIRWESSRMGTIMPGEFIPIAQKYDLMDMLGEWVMTEVCEQCVAWEKDQMIRPNISINYSLQQIESQIFVDSICRILANTKVDAKHICLEISGGGEIQNIDNLVQKFIALKAFGVKIALDRFGESTSSIRALYDLPLDIVKIDRKYSISIGEEKIDPFLTQVIAICKERGILVCVEGVEAEWQIEILLELGADFMQGFYFSRPLSAQQYSLRYLSREYVKEPREIETRGESL